MEDQKFDTADATIGEDFDLDSGSQPEGVEDYDGEDKGADFDTEAEDDGAEHEPGPIPYSRFKEVNEKFKATNAELEEFRAWQGVIEALKQDGLTDGQAAMEAMKANQQTFRDNQIRQHWQQWAYENGYSDDEAEAKAEIAIREERVKDLQSRLAEHETSIQKAEAFSKFPRAKENETFVNTLIQRGFKPSEAAKQVHELIENAERSAQTKQAGKPRPPKPMGSGDGRASTRAVAETAASPSWMKASWSQLAKMSKKETL